MMSSSFLKKDKFGLAVTVFLIVMLLKTAWQLIRINTGGTTIDDYLLAESLLYYPGSFVRRSLLGNIFLPFAPSVQRTAVSFFYSGLLLGLFWYVFRKCRDQYLLVLLLIIPFGLKFFTRENQGLYRKEQVFFVAIIIVIELYRRNRNALVNLIISIVVSILMVMVHESFVFIAAPVIIWIMYRNGAGKFHLGIYSVTVLAALLVLSPLHTPHQIAILEMYFSERGIDWYHMKSFLVITRAETIQIALKHLMEGTFLIYVLLLLPVIAYFLHGRLIRKEYGWLLAGQAMGIITLSLIAIDYGRWISFGVVAYFICLISYGGWQEFSLHIRHSMREKLLFVAMVVLFITVNPPQLIRGLTFDNLKNCFSFPLKKA